MNATPDFDRQASSWLAEGPTELSDRVLDSALREVHLTQQRRRWPASWRASLMSLRLGAAALIATVAITGILAFNMIGGVGVPAVAPSPTTLSTPTLPPTAVPSPTLGPIDTSTWASYSSARYGLTVSRPDDWSETIADHDWTWEGDIEAWQSTGVDSFGNPAGDVRFSLWGVRVAPGSTVESAMEEYCAGQNAASCPGLQDGAVDVLTASGDSGRGLYGPGQDTMAFFLRDGTMYVIAVWREETDPTVQQYGGAWRLLQGFASTLLLPPESVLSSPAPS